MAEVSDSEESSDNEEVLYHSSDGEFDARSNEDVSSENEEPEMSTRSRDEQSWTLGVDVREARIVVAVQHLADNEGMLQTGSSTKAFLSQCMRLPWKILDLFAQTLNQNMWSTYLSLLT